MKKVSDSDKMIMSIVGDIDADIKHFSQNFSIGPSKESYGVLLNRQVSIEDIMNIEEDYMPGFKLIWKYNEEVELWDQFKMDNYQFTRCRLQMCNILFLVL